MLSQPVQYQGKAGFLTEFPKWYFSKYCQVWTRLVSLRQSQLQFNHVVVTKLPIYIYAKNISSNVTIVDVYTKRIDEKVKITGGIRNDRSELNNYIN